MTSPNSSQSPSSWSEVNPSSSSRATRRVTGSPPAGDSAGFSAFSTCILVDESNQIIEFKGLAHVIVSAPVPRLLRDVAVTPQDDVGDVSGPAPRLQSRA